jgi:serine/threonine-protein kinase
VPLSNIEAELVEQIRALVERALLRQGQPSELRAEGMTLRVGRGAAGPHADIAGTVTQWPNLPDDLREKRAAQIAQLLASSPGLTAVRPRSARAALQTSRPGWLSSLRTVAIVLLTAGVVLVAYRYLTPGGAALGSRSNVLRGSPGVGTSAPPLDPDHERAALGSSACSLSAARVTRGANVGPADVEGWVVELELLRRSATEDLATSPALATLVAKKPGSAARSVVWPTAKSLAAAKRFDAEVSVQPINALGNARLKGVRLVFSGPYVAPYFTETERADYFMLADALADALHATDGALFARCADADAHYIGSWFLGANPAASVASLIYFMADFSDAPLLRPEVVGANGDPQRRDHAFDIIGSAAAVLDRSAVATLIGTELGMISGRPNQPVRLTFPFRDANRATRASLAAARALKLAASR